jgi:hypothetical protein
MSDLGAILADTLVGDHSAGYGFWYSDYSGTVESTSGTASANSYNEKSLKPHQSE